MTEKLWTYQEIAQKFEVCVDTVRRWLRGAKGKVHPTKRTVRFKDSTVQKLFNETPDVKRKR
jgi:predicted site-specific integrase-resolvase